MKRVLTILAILLLPLSVWAMTPVSDSALSDVTGQAGVSINIDLNMNISFDTVAWGDQSGIEAGGGADGPDSDTDPDGGWEDFGSAGYIGLTGFNLYNLRIMYYDTYADEDEAIANFKALTIDVATISDTDTDGGEDLFADYSMTTTGNLTFVRIGLGSLAIKIGDLSFDVGLSEGYYDPDDPTAGIPDLGEKLGYVAIGGLEMYINPNSYVDISNGNRTGAGVTIGMNIIIDTFKMDYVSWGGDGMANIDITDLNGDLESWASTTDLGYIGIKDLYISGPISVKGIVNIDVGTATAGLYNGHTFVHISFGTPGIAAPAGDFSNGIGMDINVGALRMNVGLDTAPDLVNVTDSHGTLGDIYIGNFGVEIESGSWVDIWAH